MRLLQGGTSHSWHLGQGRDHPEFGTPQILRIPGSGHPPLSPPPPLCSPSPYTAGKMSLLCSETHSGSLCWLKPSRPVKGGALLECAVQESLGLRPCPGARGDAKAHL